MQATCGEKEETDSCCELLLLLVSLFIIVK